MKIVINNFEGKKMAVSEMGKIYKIKNNIVQGKVVRRIDAKDAKKMFKDNKIYDLSVSRNINSEFHNKNSIKFESVGISSAGYISASNGLYLSALHHH